MKISAITLVTISLALAEPPASYQRSTDRYLSPQNEYLPPQNKYLPPQNRYLPSSTPTASNYLPPVGPSVIEPQAVLKPKYGAPSRTYISPSTIYGAPSGSYGAPSGSYGAPSGSYGAPSGSYGAPSGSDGAPSGSYGAPSSTYGIPSNILKSTYGVPYEAEGYHYGDQSSPASYSFEYHVQDAQSGNDFGHSEQREGDEAKGKYFVLLPDGRLQTVEYTANKEGYKPKITYQVVGYSEAGYPAASGGYQ